MAFSAQGTLLKVGDGASPEVFTAIAELSDIDGIGWAASVIETTSHDSGRQTFVAGLEESDSFSFSGNYDPTDAQQTAIIAAIKARSVTNIQIVVPSATPVTIDTAGFFTEMKIGLPVNDKATLTGTFQKDGSVETTVT